MSLLRKLLSVFGFVCLAGAGAIWAQAEKNRVGESAPARFPEGALGEARQVKAPPESVLHVTESRLKMGMRVSRDEDGQARFHVLFKDEEVTQGFTQPAFDASRPAADIPVEAIVQFWGTREGIGIAAGLWASRIAGRPVHLSSLDIRDGVPTQVDAVALFRVGDGFAAWVVVVNERGNPEVFGIVPLSADSCTASPPGHSNCSCTASGANRHCRSWVDPSSGTGYSQCSDGTDTTQCRGKGGSCECRAY